MTNKFVKTNENFNDKSNIILKFIKNNLIICGNSLYLSLFTLDLGSTTYFIYGKNKTEIK